MRLAWLGRKPKYEGELNCGSFCVIQLYHERDCGTRENPTTFREMWDATTVSDNFGESCRIKLDRGPIFSKNGDLKRDWDPRYRIPIFAMTLDEAYSYEDGTPIKTEDVFSGKFIEAVRSRLTPIVARVQTKGREMARDLDRTADALGREMGDFLWHEANKTGQTRDHTVTISEANAAMALKEKRDRWRNGFEDYYVPPSPKV
jgi:hypothetical protein